MKKVDDEKVSFPRKQEPSQNFIETLISGFYSFDRGPWLTELLKVNWEQTNNLQNK